MIPGIAAIISIIFAWALMILLTPAEKKPTKITKYKDFFIDADGIITYYKGIDIKV